MDSKRDGKNEIAATRSATVYKWIAGKYRIIGFNNWIFNAAPVFVKQGDDYLYWIFKYGWESNK